VKRAGADSVPLPTERDDGEAVAKKPGVASIMREILVTAIHKRQNAGEAAVGVFEEHSAIALGGIFGANSDKIRGKFDFAVLEIDGVLEIDDGFVVDVVYGDREEDFTGDAFVGAGIAEGLSIENIDARDDFDASNASDEGRNCENENERHQNCAKNETRNRKIHAREDNTDEAVVGSIARGAFEPNEINLGPGAY